MTLSCLVLPCQETSLRARILVNRATNEVPSLPFNTLNLVDYCNFRHTEKLDVAKSVMLGRRTREEVQMKFTEGFVILQPKEETISLLGGASSEGRGVLGSLEVIVKKGVKLCGKEGVRIAINSVDMASGGAVNAAKMTAKAGSVAATNVLGHALMFDGSVGAAVAELPEVLANLQVDPSAISEAAQSAAGGSVGQGVAAEVSQLASEPTVASGMPAAS